jgi:hypothetical protein
LSCLAWVHAKEPITVKMGANFSNLYELSSDKNSFGADIWVWSVTEVGDKYSLKDSLDVDYFNSKHPIIYSEDASFVMKNGLQYQLRKIQGTFIHEYELANFPFDHQKMTIHLEDKDRDISKIKYIPDVESSGYRKDLKLDGWKINKVDITGVTRDYDSNFGDSDVSKDQHYSHLEFSIDLSRYAYLIFIKMTLGLVAAVLLAIFSCHMPTYEAEIFSGRMVIISTALLATVLNQQFADDRIGEHLDLTLIDKLHILGIVIIFLYIVYSVFNRYLYSKNFNQKLLINLDKIAFYLGLVVFFVCFFAMTLAAIFN